MRRHNICASDNCRELYDAPQVIDIRTVDDRETSGMRFALIYLYRSLKTESSKRVDRFGDYS